MAENCDTVHATCIAIGDAGVLIRGPSGSGKSDLALRLLYTPLPTAFGNVRLICDDQVHLTRNGQEIIARPIESIRNKLEARGIGIVSVESICSAAVRLVVDAVAPEVISRMPKPDELLTSVLSVPIPRVALAALEPSAVAKVLVALERTLVREHVR